MAQTCLWQREIFAALAAASVERFEKRQDADPGVVSATEAEISILRSEWNGRYKILGFYGIYMKPARIIPSDIGCPNNTKCNIACQKDPCFNTKGYCVGPDELLCSCGPPHHGTDLPVNVEAKARNDQECERKCAEYRMPMTGKCT
ncbi:hypothetical protein AVEN_137808-1 [Araneus ventricosus]|uniref:Uncharacterized protein n=1 Tax=Araneus ventricosus TaxID=182803 RepID=A0A4Y2U1R0_ARAVE|nr:hypothetical protein AVEN_137808-1 [Araneus ventricosus]